MTAIIKTYCHLNIPVWKMTAASRSLCIKRNVLITKNNITFVPRKLSSSLTKATLQLNSCRMCTFGSLCRFTTAQNNKLSVPLSDSYTQHCLRHCRVAVVVAVGLVVGWTVLELHQHRVSCVAEATEMTECHGNKEQTDQQCPVASSLEEVIHESDQLLQRVKVREINFVSLCFIVYLVFCALRCDADAKHCTCQLASKIPFICQLLERRQLILLKKHILQLTLAVFFKFPLLINHTFA